MGVLIDALTAEPAQPARPAPRSELDSAPDGRPELGRVLRLRKRA